MADLPERLRDLAESLTGNNWDHPITARGDCLTAAAELERLTRQVQLLHDATIVLRNGMGGHNHLDSTMRRGEGCQICIAQREARDNADRMIDEAAEKARTT
jgi:hypothetical protein